MGKSSAKKCQSSLEYLLIVALTFAVIIPTTYLFYSYSKESGQELVDAQITKIGRNLVDTSETIFYSGDGSKTIIKVNMPDNVDVVTIVEGRELVFNLSNSFGVSEIVFFSLVNMSTDGSYCTGNVCKIDGFADGGLKNLKIHAINSRTVDLRVT
jgi:uncharacterized protein (UPF0333 family)